MPILPPAILYCRYPGVNGGLDSVTVGGRSIKRELIIELRTSGLTSETGEIIRYRAINR